MNTIKSILKRIGKILYIFIRPAHTLKRIEKLQRMTDVNHDTEQKLRHDNHHLRRDIDDVMSIVRESLKLSRHRLVITTVQEPLNGDIEWICKIFSMDDENEPVVEFQHERHIGAIRAAMSVLNADRQSRGDDDGSIQIDRVIMPRVPTDDEL